jgi:hypothetical protein
MQRPRLTWKVQTLHVPAVPWSLRNGTQQLMAMHVDLNMCARHVEVVICQQRLQAILARRACCEHSS